MGISQSLNYERGEAHSLLVIANCRAKENVSQGIQSAMESLRLYEKLKDNTGIVTVNGWIQNIYRDLIKDYRKSLEHAFYALKVAEKNKVIGGFVFTGQRYTPLTLAEIGQTYILMGMLDSALHYTRKSIDYDEQFNGSTWNFPYYLLATIQFRMGDYTSTLKELSAGQIPSCSKQLANGYNTD